MKAYFPGLALVKEKKKNIFPPPQPKGLGLRSNTTGNNPNTTKLTPYSERIIFVDNTRKITMNN